MADQNLHAVASPSKLNRKCDRSATVFESNQERNRQEQQRACVYLGETFEDWRRLRNELGLVCDSELARRLIDRYYEVDDLESKHSRSQSNRKILHLERRLLTMWNSVKTSNGISSDKEFLWYLLLVLEKYCQGMTHTTPSQTFTGLQQEHGTVVTGHATSDVGPGHATSPSSPNLNDAANTSLALQPAVCQSNLIQDTSQSLNSAANTSLALPSALCESGCTEATGTLTTVLPATSCHTQDTLGMFMLTTPTQQVAMEVGETVQKLKSSSACQDCLHPQGDEKSNRVQSPQDRSCRKQVLSPDLEEPVLSEGSEMDSNNSAAMPCKMSQKPSHVDREQKESDEHLPDCAKSGKENSSRLQDLGSCDTSNVVSQPSSSTAHVDIEDEVEQEDEDESEETEEELSSFEDKKGHESNILSEGEGDNDKSSCNRKITRKQRKKRGNKKWVCKCKKEFDTKLLFYKHRLEVHPKKCEYCEEKFPTTVALNRHLMTHLPSGDKLDLHGNVMVLCDFCGQFISKLKIKSHKLTHSKERPYKCEVENCTSAFKKMEGLKKHLRDIHSGPATCIFEGCEKVLSSKRQMMKHLKLHAGERSYLCSYCGKTFQRAGHLRVHLRIHTGDLPFNCSLCNYSGRQYNSLRWHMKTQHRGQADKLEETCSQQRM